MLKNTSRRVVEKRVHEEATNQESLLFIIGPKMLDEIVCEERATEEKSEDEKAKHRKIL
jgi:hypothetical protein